MLRATDVFAGSNGHGTGQRRDIVVPLTVVEAVTPGSDS